MTLLHITHPKAGSQWIYKILHQSAPNKTIKQDVCLKQFNATFNIEEGRIHPTLYIPYYEYHYAIKPKKHDYFVVVRDCRDALISHYFSIKYTHQITNNSLNFQKMMLNMLDIKQGLLFLINLPRYFLTMVNSWLGNFENIVRYENLLDHDIDILVPLLLPHVECNKNTLEQLIIKNRFTSVTGRNRGDENINSHERKGIHGDWKNYFDDDIKLAFKNRWGELLIKLGYEKNNDW